MTSVTSAVLAVVLAGGAAACSGSPQQDGSGDGDTAGDEASSTQAAPPGRYRTLPEPCGAVGEDTLAGLFPNADPDDDAGGGSSAAPDDAPYGGEPDVTYDTDRSVGCTWQHSTSVGSRRLAVDFERVVSYDTSVSDDDEAARLFEGKAEKAGLTTGTDGADGDGDGPSKDDASSGTEAQGTEGSGGGAAPDDEGDGGSPSPDAGASPETEPVPRLLQGVGDAAFLDDELSGDGDTARRTVTLVFRTSNVLVTVEYTQAMTDGHRTPAAKELEDRTQDLARQLVGRFDDI
jgi:hypothetical protein